MGFLKSSMCTSPVGFIAVTVAEEAFTAVDEAFTAAEAAVAKATEAAGKKIACEYVWKNGWPQWQKQQQKQQERK